MSDNKGGVRGPSPLTDSLAVLLSQASEAAIVLWREPSDLPRLAPTSACMQVLGNQAKTAASRHRTHHTNTQMQSHQADGMDYLCKWGEKSLILLSITLSELCWHSQKVTWWFVLSSLSPFFFMLHTGELNLCLKVSYTALFHFQELLL